MRMSILSQMLFIDWKGASSNCDCTNLIYERSLMMIKYKNLSLFIIVSNYYQGNNNKRHIQLNCYEMHTSIWSRASSRASIFGFSTTQWSLFHQKYTIYSSIRKRNTMSSEHSRIFFPKLLTMFKWNNLKMRSINFYILR